MPVSHRLRRYKDPLGRIALFALLWLVIAGSDPGSWIIGAPAVLFASWVSLRLRAAAVGPDRNGMRLGGLLRFAPFFAIESIRGGLDVAQRVMRPQLRINPGFQSYRPRLSDPIARVVFLDSISLLPGTLSADMREGVIQVHALDARSDLAPELARLERRIADLFGEQLQPAPE